MNLPTERAYRNAMAVQRAREDNAVRMAGCPLERWLQEYEETRWGKANPNPRRSSYEEILALFRSAA